MSELDAENFIHVGFIIGFAVTIILWYILPKLTKLSKEKVGGLSASVGSSILLVTIGRALNSFNKPLDYFVTLALVIWAYIGCYYSIKKKEQKKK